MRNIICKLTGLPLMAYAPTSKNSLLNNSLVFSKHWIFSLEPSQAIKNLLEYDLSAITFSKDAEAFLECTLTALKVGMDSGYIIWNDLVFADEINKPSNYSANLIFIKVLRKLMASSKPFRALPVLRMSKEYNIRSYAILFREAVFEYMPEYLADWLDSENPTKKEKSQMIDGLEYNSTFWDTAKENIPKQFIEQNQNLFDSVDFYLSRAESCHVTTLPNTASLERRKLYAENDPIEGYRNLETFLKLWASELYCGTTKLNPFVDEYGKPLVAERIVKKFIEDLGKRKAAENIFNDEKVTTIYTQTNLMISVLTESKAEIKNDTNKTFAEILAARGIKR